MTKLLDADWLKSVQLFINCTAVQLLNMPKRTKWRKALQTQRELPPEELRQND